MRILMAVALVMMAGCAAQTAAITAGGSQVELRQMQTREYDTLDKRGTLRSVVATLQDLGFVIDDPKSYQDFFAALDKAMFLTLHKVD